MWGPREVKPWRAETAVCTHVAEIAAIVTKIERTRKCVPGSGAATISVIVQCQDPLDPSKGLCVAPRGRNLIPWMGAQLTQSIFRKRDF
jgi:hypothetical protein